MGPRERCKLLQWDLGWSCSRQTIWCILEAKVQLGWQQFLLIFLRTNVFFAEKSLISYGGSNSSQDGALWGVFFSWGSRHRCTMEVGAYDTMRCEHYHSCVVDADVSQTCLISVRLRDVLPCTCKNGWTNRYTASSVWNSLPVSVQNCDTLTLFKSRLKAHLFSSVYAS